jgi:hypothetical protein
MSISQISRLSAAVLLAAFLVSCGSVPTQPAASNGPTVSMVVPQSNGVGTNRAVAVLFSQPMDPASINSSSFLVAGVSGTVVYDARKRCEGMTRPQVVFPLMARSGSHNDPLPLRPRRLSLHDTFPDHHLITPSGHACPKSRA